MRKWISANGECQVFSLRGGFGVHLRSSSCGRSRHGFAPGFEIRRDRHHEQLSKSSLEAVGLIYRIGPLYPGVESRLA